MDFNKPIVSIQVIIITDFMIRTTKQTGILTEYYYNGPLSGNYLVIVVYTFILLAQPFIMYSNL